MESILGAEYSFVTFFTNLFSKIKISKITTPQYNKMEEKIINILTTMVNSSTVNQLHCNTKANKYYVIVGANTIVVDGDGKKVYMLNDENKYMDAPHPFVAPIRESVITDLIDIIVNRKHEQTEEIYDRILEGEQKFLNSFQIKVDANK